MKRGHLAAVAVFVCIARPGWSAVTDTYSNPKAGAIRKVCLLSLEATLTRAGVKGGENLPKESEEWAGKLGTAVRHAISAAGDEVTGDLSLDPLQLDDDTRQSVVRLKHKYESIAVQMRKKPWGVEKGRYTLGDEVALAPCAGQAESLAFVNGQGVLPTGGRKAFSVLRGGLIGLAMAQARYEIWIALVDAKTGRVTALMDVVSTGGKTREDPEGTLSPELTEQFRKLRVGAATKVSSK
jgi:hypothetical protein